MLPGTYEIPGARSTAAISLHQQRCEYVRAHQRRRAGLEGQDAVAATLSKDSDLRFECGEYGFDLMCLEDGTIMCSHMLAAGC